MSTSLSARISSIEDLDHALVASRHDLETLLANALAIEAAPALFVGPSVDVTAIALATAGPYVMIEHGRVTGTALFGPPPAGIDRVIALPDQLAQRARTRQLFRTQLLTTRREAARLCNALRDDGETFSQHAFTELERWAPLLALHAYRQSVILQSMFDVERSLAITALRERESAHRQRAHELSHLSMLAAVADPSDWLADMAQTFTWRTWTPSFPLVRERMLRLALRGGWIAARFGTPMVAPYLGRIASGQPMHAFDAALGLVAIASTSAQCGAIADELASVLALRAEGPDGSHFAAIARSAAFALDQPEVAVHHVLHQRGAADLWTAVDSDEDPADVDSAGYFHALLAITSLATAPAATLFRVRRRSLADVIRDHGSTIAEESAKRSASARNGSQEDLLHMLGGAHGRRSAANAW